MQRGECRLSAVHRHHLETVDPEEHLQAVPGIVVVLDVEDAVAMGKRNETHAPLYAGDG